MTAINLMIISIFIQKICIMKPSQLQFLFFSFCIFVLALSDDSVEEKPTPISLKQTFYTAISAGQIKTFSLTIRQYVPQGDDLYVRAEPRVPNPLHSPYLLINADKGYELKCFNALASFSSVCRVPRSELTPKRNFTLTLSCFGNCQLSLRTYLSNSLTLHLGQEVIIPASDTDLITVVKVPIPQDATYKSLIATAFIKNIEENVNFAKEGLMMLLNYGNNSVTDPTEKQFMLQSQQMFSGGRVAFLSVDDVKPGSWIKILLKVRKGMGVILNLSPHDGKQQKISLGRSVFDLVKADTPKLYEIGTSSHFSTIQNNTIQLVFDFYSGSPVVTIGFDSSFNRAIQVSRNHPSVSVELTAQLRKDKQFNGTLLVKVESTQASEFYFYSQIVNDDVTFVKPYTAYFDQLQKEEVYNFILDERYTIDPKDGESNYRNYSLKVNTEKGITGDIYIRRCYSLEMGSKNNKQNLDQCIIRSSDALDSLEFVKQQIETKRVSSGQLLNINLSYDISQCSLVEKGEGGKEVRQCSFQVVTRGDRNATDAWAYTLQVERKFHMAYLREGKITKQYLAKNNYAYFAFALPDYTDVTDITIFTTTYSGQSVLLVSSTEQLPSIESTEEGLLTETGSRASIHLSNSDKKLSEVYIAVYARSFAEVNIGVSVSRVGGNGIKQIHLEPSNVVEYTLAKGQKEVHFLIQVNEQSRALAHINELVGMVEMVVVDNGGEEVECLTEGSNRQTCEFVTQQNIQYTIIIKSRSSHEQKFTVGFVNTELCKKGLLNSPTTVILNGYVMDCYSFDINRAKDVQYMSSITSIDLLKDEIQVQVMFNEIQYGMINPGESMLTVGEMISKCHLGRKTNTKDFVETCKVSLNFVSITKSQKQFMFILEEESNEMALFDGIAKQTKNVNVNVRDIRFYNYKVTNSKSIKIFLTTPSKAINFLVRAKFETKDHFSKRTGTEFYPPFVARDQRKQGELAKGLYQAELGSVGTSVITIDRDDIKMNMNPDCYLLISVFPDPTTLQKRANRKTDTIFSSFNIEVVQTESNLDIGETKTGFVRVKHYDSYIINPQDGIITVRNMDQEGSHNMPCAKLKGALPSGKIVKEADIIGGSLQISKDDKIEYIYVKGTEDKCSYQLSYTSLDMPLNNAKLSQPYEIRLGKGETKKFIHYHANPVSLKIVKLVASGTLHAHIYPIKDRGISLQDALKININKYPIIDTEPKEHVVSKDDSNFCDNCFYLVVFESPDKFDGEVIFLRNGDAIPLATNHFLQQWLLPNSEFAEEQYLYYSQSQFNLTVEIISGSVEILILHPDGSVLFRQLVEKKTSFQVRSNFTGSEDVYYSSKTRFSIKATAKAEVEFYLKVNKNKLSEMIVEGMPATFHLSSETPLPLQFSSGQSMRNNLSLMVSFDPNQVDPKTPELSFDVRGTDEKGQDSTLLLNTTQSGMGSYILSLKNFRGVYIVQVVSQVELNITVVLFNKKLTQLIPNKRHFFDQEGLFQLFTQQKNVLVEVFNCQGDFSLLASKDYRDIKKISRNKNSPITLRRPNYAGHYVIGVQGIFGSYFMRVDSKEVGSPVEYQIAYSHYQETNPYNLIDAKNYDLEYDESSSGVMVKFNQVVLLEEGVKLMKIESITYKVYAADSRFNLKRKSRCGIVGPVALKQVSDSKAYLQTELLEKAKAEDSESDNIYITVEAIVRVSYLSGEDSEATTKLRIFYNTIDLSQSKDYKYLFTDSFLILIAWLILPFVIAGIVVFYLLRYCIRRVMALRGDLVEEIEIVAASNPTVPSNSRLAAPVTLDHPDSAKVQIKEHI